MYDFHLRGLPLAQGTVTGGLKIIKPLFEPVVEGIREKVTRDEQWHADETRWMVWGDEGSEKHWLWGFLTSTAAYYSGDDSRASTVPKGLLCESNGVLVCDRYSV